MKYVKWYVGYRNDTSNDFHKQISAHRGGGLSWTPFPRKSFKITHAITFLISILRPTSHSSQLTAAGTFLRRVQQTPSFNLKQNTQCPQGILRKVVRVWTQGVQLYINATGQAFNPLEHTAGCQTVETSMSFACNSSFLSVDGMTCLISFESWRKTLSNGVSYV